MKKIYLAAALTILVSSCASHPPAGSSQASSQFMSVHSASSVATTGWKTYTNNKYHFHVAYPSDWAWSDQFNPRAIVQFYDPAEAATLGACEKTYPHAQWQLHCGPAEADTAIAIIATIPIDYAALDDWDKQNFKNEQTDHIGSLNAFEYDDGTVPPVHTFQVNSPKGQTSLSFGVWKRTDANSDIARAMLSTLVTY